MSRIVWALPLFLLSWFAFTMPTNAEGENIAVIDLSRSSITACNATPGVIEGFLVIVAYNASGEVENPPGAQMPFYVSFISGGTTDAQSHSAATDLVWPFSVSLGNYHRPYIKNVTINVRSPRSGASASINVVCDIPDEEGEEVVIPDERVNLGGGDLINAVYNTSDDDGVPALGVWTVDTSSNGIFSGYFAYALFEPYLDNPPAQNTRLGMVGQTTLYALTTGEFQIVIGPDAEGKTYTTVFNGLPMRDAYQPIP